MLGQVQDQLVKINFDNRLSPGLEVPRQIAELKTKGVNPLRCYMSIGLFHSYIFSTLELSRQAINVNNKFMNLDLILVVAPNYIKVEGEI